MNRRDATHIRLWSNNPNDVYFACGAFWTLRDERRPHWANVRKNATCKQCLKWLEAHPDTEAQEER